MVKLILAVALLVCALASQAAADKLIESRSVKVTSLTNLCGYNNNYNGCTAFTKEQASLACNGPNYSIKYEIISIKIAGKCNTQYQNQCDIECAIGGNYSNYYAKITIISDGTCTCDIYE